jgi:two-component system NtrC family response regulator
MLEMLSTIGRVASTDAPVLILGESGTGKELVAEAIHQNSHRKQGPLVKLNLGGMSASLFESEMFGHVRGAFTDAKQDRKGRFEVADSGSIFLDEMGDLEPSSQVKLLRVLQDQSFQPVGSSETRRANVRVISATNRNLHEMVGDGSFREDLLYRLNLITIRIPPLRNRRGDIRLLAESHLQKVSEIYNVPLVSIDESGMSWLEQQSWPGNVRQLAQTIERAVLMSNQAQLSINDFQTERGHPAQSAQTELPVGSMTLDEMEKLMIEKAIKAYNRNLSKVAQALGISRAALYRRIEKYGLNS